MDLDEHIPAIQERDPAAFGRWMAGAEAPLRDSLRSFARVVDVEAVLQEALLRVWRVAPRFVPDGKANGLFRLAIRIARNLAISEVRKAKTASAPASLDGAADEVAVDIAPPDPLLRDAMAHCFELLPPQPRKVIALRIMSAGEADLALATSLQMRLNTFLQNFGRARKLLAECLAKAGITVDVTGGLLS